DKREIKAKDVLRDIRAGMSNDELMNRYHLSSKGLRSVFKKLVDAGVVRPDEMKTRMPVIGDEMIPKDRRKEPRCYPIAPFLICDLDDLRTEGSVLDISGNGLKVAGIGARLGQRKNMLIQAEDFDEVYPFSFEAECRWTKVSSDGARVTGFEITNIPELGARELGRLIKSITFSD
ncbi:MAG: PilZ domain-containing protein, partial [Deltaproteobacteria bacterium]|nr:PilZ domain-containing protein [Deltaproteobacteria bacterium]